MSKKENEIVSDEVRPRRWLLVVLILLALAIIVVLINKKVMDSKNNDDSNGLYDFFSNPFVTETTDKINKSSFNSQFEMYMGTEYGSSVSRLLDEVITNNKKNKNQLVEVIYNDITTFDPTEIKDLKKNFDTWDKLEVSLDYDDEGYVNLVTIEDYEANDNNVSINTNGSGTVNNNVTNNTTSEFTKTSFNSQATFHSGDKSGFFVTSMIDNGSNRDHLLYVEYNGTKATDSDTLTSLKNKFSDFTDYNVSVTYAADGFANGFIVK